MIESVAQDDNKWFHWRPEIFGDIFSYKVYQPLPSREECYSLINDFFVGLNKVKASGLPEYMSHLIMTGLSIVPRADFHVVGG